MSAAAATTTRDAADALAGTAAERDALGVLRRLTGASGGPMERHGLRVFLIAEEAGRRRGLALDRELLLVAALLHDLGLYVADPEPGEAYVTDGRVLAEELAARHAWPAERATRAGEAVEQHHARRAQWARGPEAELLRRADLADLTRDRIRPLGLGGDFLRALDARVPPKGIRPHIAGQVLGQVRRRPGSLGRIFRTD